MARCGCGDRCACTIVSGNNTVVQGVGTPANPYVVDVINPGVLSVRGKGADSNGDVDLGDITGLALDSDDVPYVTLDSPDPTPAKRLITEATAQGYVGELSDVDAALSFRNRLFAGDVMISYERDLPGEDWDRKDGALVVPHRFSDATNPTQLPTMLDALYSIRAGYRQTRTSSPGSSTKKGLLAGPAGVDTELMFLGDEWHFGQANLYPEIGFTFKRPCLMLRPGMILRGQAGQTRFVGHDVGGGSSNLIGTSYRPYNELAIRENGTIAPWLSSEVKTYQSGGSGQVAAGSGPAFTSWRYVKTPSAIITADVQRGSSTLTVDNVDGIDRAWFSANGLAIPADLTANRLRVGDWVVWTQGQNPIDAHERVWIEYVQVKAINGNFAVGTTGTGAGTITVSRRAAVDTIIANQFWSFPLKYPRAFHALSAANGGVDNIEAHALTKIDLSLWWNNGYVGGIEFITDPAAAVSPNNFLGIAGVIGPTVEDVSVWNPSVNGLDFNACISPVLRNVRQLASNGGGQGLLADAGNTRDMKIYGFYAEGFQTSAFQAESYSSVVIEGSVINNDHPANTGAQGVYLLNQAELTLRDLTWTAGRGGILVARGVGSNLQAPFTVEGRIRIIGPSATARPSFRMSDFSPEARVKYTGWNAAGTAIRDIGFAPQRRWQPVVIPFQKTSTTATVTVPLPPGAIRDVQIRLPSNTTGLKTLLFRNGVTSDISALGRRATHVTNPAIDSIGDGVGSAADRTLTSSTGEFVGATNGDPVVWRGGNLDGTDFISDIVDASGAPNTIVIEDLTPQPLVSGQQVTVGDTAVAGKATRMTSLITGFDNPTKRGSFNMGKMDQEAAGIPSTAVAVFDSTTTDATGDIIIEVLTYPVSATQGGEVDTTANGFAPLRPTVSGDKQGSESMASVLAALRAGGFILDATVDSGKNRSQDPIGLVQPYPVTDAQTLGTTIASGTIYFVQFRPTISKALATLWAQAFRAGVLGSAVCTYMRMGFYEINAAGDTFVESGVGGQDTTQFTASTRIEFAQTTPGQANAGALSLMAFLATWTGTPTTIPQLSGKALNAGISGLFQRPGLSGIRPFGAAGTGQAALPSSILVSALGVGGTGSAWMGAG